MSDQSFGPGSSVWRRRTSTHSRSRPNKLSAKRISPTEKAAIVSAARAVLPTGSGVLLFGCRTDDHRRGGDIDLLVELPAPLSAQQSASLSTQLAGRLYRLMGERRIDILVATADEADDRLVVAEARRDGLEMVRT